jgi:hypothetical protein
MPQFRNSEHYYEKRYKILDIGKSPMLSSGRVVRPFVLFFIDIDPGALQAVFADVLGRKGSWVAVL